MSQELTDSATAVLTREVGVIKDANISRIDPLATMDQMLASGALQQEEVNRLNHIMELGLERRGILRDEQIPLSEQFREVEALDRLDELAAEKAYLLRRGIIPTHEDEIHTLYLSTWEQELDRQEELYTKEIAIPGNPPEVYKKVHDTYAIISTHKDLPQDLLIKYFRGDRLPMRNQQEFRDFFDAMNTFLVATNAPETLSSEEKTEWIMTRYTLWQLLESKRNSSLQPPPSAEPVPPVETEKQLELQRTLLAYEQLMHTAGFQNLDEIRARLQQVDVSNDTINELRRLVIQVVKLTDGDIPRTARSAIDHTMVLDLNATVRRFEEIMHPKPIEVIQLLHESLDSVELPLQKHAPDIRTMSDEEVLNLTASRWLQAIDFNGDSYLKKYAEVRMYLQVERRGDFVFICQKEFIGDIDRYLQIAEEASMFDGKSIINSTNRKPVAILLVSSEHCDRSVVSGDGTSMLIEASEEDTSSNAHKVPESTVYHEFTHINLNHALGWCKSSTLTEGMAIYRERLFQPTNNNNLRNAYGAAEMKWMAKNNVPFELSHTGIVEVAQIPLSKPEEVYEYSYAVGGRIIEVLHEKLGVSWEDILDVYKLASSDNLISSSGKPLIENGNLLVKERELIEYCLEQKQIAPQLVKDTLTTHLQQLYASY